MTLGIKLDFPQSALVDDDDFDMLSEIDWYVCINGGLPYARRHDQKSMPVGETWMHRLIMKCPKGLLTHHENGKSLDNRKENLKILTRKQHDFLHKLRRQRNLDPAINSIALDTIGEENGNG